MYNVLNDGILLVRSGRLHEGLEAYNKALENPELRLQAFGNRAILLRAMGRYEEALHDYDELLRNGPNTEAELMRADLLHTMGRKDEAVTVAVSAIQRDPMNALATKLLSQWQEAAGKSPPQKEWIPYLDRNMPASPLNPALAMIEADPNSFPASIFPENGRLLYLLVRLCRPSLVVETGCYIGYSSICLAQALEENEHGHLHSFDIFPEIEYKSPIIGKTTGFLPVARAHIEHAGLAHRVTLHKGDAAVEIPRAFPSGEPKVQMAFIDADHTLNGAFSDWRQIDQVLEDGAIVVLHDTFPEGSGVLGPAGVVSRLQTTPGFQYQAISLPSRQGQGLGIVQKLSSERIHKWRPKLADLAAEYFLESRFSRRLYRYGFK